MVSFAQSASATTSTSATTTHTISSASVTSLTDGVGFLFIERNDGGSTADVITGATWGGVSMTSVGSVPHTQPFNVRLHMYRLESPPTGTVNIVATSSVNINTRMWWLTIQDAFQGAPEASNSGTTTNSTTNTLSVTTLSDNALVVGCGVARGNSNVPSAQSGTTIQLNSFDAWLSWTSPQTTAGSNTSGVTGLTSTTDSTAIVAVYGSAVASAKRGGIFLLW